MSIHFAHPTRNEQLCAAREAKTHHKQDGIKHTSKPDGIQLYFP